MCVVMCVLVLADSSNPENPVCDCDVGYSGVNCQHELGCADNSCNENGDCHKDPHNYYCK